VVTFEVLVVLVSIVDLVVLKVVIVLFDVEVALVSIVDLAVL
tara:strand:- start:561 stop:686 length:126 start_codon:yes stop_codon:yes gene_type:complete